MFNFFSKEIFWKVFTILALGIALIFNHARTAKSIEHIDGAFQRGLIVLSSTSLSEAMHEIIKNFSIEKNISVSATFKSSNELARDIEFGEAANIIISEDAKKMRELQRKGVLNVFSIGTLASDRLALVVPKNHYLLRQINKSDSIEENLKKVISNSIPVIPDPNSDPAGRYIKESLQTLKLWEKAKKKTIKALNTRYALYLITKGQNSGIIYLSDAMTDKNLEIIGIIPQKYHEKIIYQMAIVAEIGSSENLKDSEDFVHYLKGKEARKVLKNRNFGSF
jgi:molybdate transport system substrate-binding protein